MKAKLIKDSDGYWLDISDDGITKRPLTDFGQLSIKNCEVIANGYDLDDLASERLSTRFNENSGYHKFVYLEAYKEGFQKALEIIGDKKKFSINEVVELSKILISNPIEKCGKTPQELVDSYVKSLQQTEWDVKIEMKYLPSLSYCNKCQKLINPLIPCTDETKSCGNWRPKLDENNCLILKRV